ncbi:MAG: hypothetical protein JWN66_4875 [Sphingomonas bacterium]|jgi:hypothetical protein|uniref:DUF2252 family protein n=1 Tax=Sphingomonas bacterium TaxID=1895847 RepID=UPI00261338D7|nr:DUF2252 family protein [Sphingomonas bacterium]MDB5707759.1 hypothetical protein [Sphingomonas bacterium]
MISFSASIAAYEAGLRAAFGRAVRERDLKDKHEKMRESAFLFLRATCWRWAEAAPELCPTLMEAPRAPSVGDAHAGNFGLWRDAEGRLAWGVNDYDEAARLPYALDLVRLCASILLADEEAGAAETADQALAGYRQGITAPSPFVLERDHLWLRDAFAATDHERADFWQELDDADEALVMPESLRPPLIAALPDMARIRVTARSAGAGSLGRPRYVASGLYRGGPVAAEIKGLMPSSWQTAREPGLAQRMARGQWRSPDPMLVYGAGHVLRRLAPNSRKLKFEKIRGKLRGRLIEAMAADLAAVHVADGQVRMAIEADLAERPAAWLADAAKRVAKWTHGEFASYAAASDGAD